MSNNAEIVKQAVSDAITQLTMQGSGNRAGKLTAWGTAMLAKLRRAVGKAPGESADVWEITIGALPKELQGYDDKPNFAELAVHTALTLFGLHQQGRIESVSENGASFGKAVRYIIISDGIKEEGVRRRFNALATAESFTELSHHARSLVQLMKSVKPKPACFDYPQFAVDLYYYQFGSEIRNNVRMGWGRDFYSFKKENIENINEEENDDE
ncbi:MAG: type I-E CRISPR-associated protein Cse2/CasB [Syntrophomonadaceae bacterium]|jgi:CRISPR system Cascade subunit CasB|nr:type I-E CRISPR-associated protein Cse2/CasB [Syntrophomonadaceae bacterium]